MILSELFERFIEKSPIPVVIRATLERVLTPEKLDQWFDLNAKKQYTRNLLFSSIFELMELVVFKVFPSVNAAYQGKVETMRVSLAATYDKLNGIEPGIAAALVRDTSKEMSGLIQGLNSECAALLPGFKIKMLDGNCIEKTEHRLEVLRYTNAGPLPGKSLVIYEPALEQATAVFPCEDGHAQERSLLKDVLPTIQANDVIIADRNFCVREFMFGIEGEDGLFVIRHHSQVPYKVLGNKRLVGNTETGKVYEQKINITFKLKGEEEEKEMTLRLVELKLKNKTRDGDRIIRIMTNLPIKVANAKKIAQLYRERWTIETMFQHLTTHLNSEINTLGYPRAALFGFCIGLIAYNLLSVVKAAMRSVYGEEKINHGISGYYLAGEISRTKEGMEIALPAKEWEMFGEISQNKFLSFLKMVMENINLAKYKKHTRGDKKPLPKREKCKKKPHVSTFKLLNAKLT